MRLFLILIVLPFSWFSAHQSQRQSLLTGEEMVIDDMIVGYWAERENPAVIYQFSEDHSLTASDGSGRLINGSWTTGAVEAGTVGNYSLYLNPLGESTARRGTIVRVSAEELVLDRAVFDRMEVRIQGPGGAGPSALDAPPVVRLGELAVANPTTCGASVPLPNQQGIGRDDVDRQAGAQSAAVRAPRNAPTLTDTLLLLELQAAACANALDESTWTKLHAVRQGSADAATFLALLSCGTPDLGSPSAAGSDGTTRLPTISFVEMSDVRLVTDETAQAGVTWWVTPNAVAADATSHCPGYVERTRTYRLVDGTWLIDDERA